MVQIMMKIPEENMAVRIALRCNGTWSLMRMGMGIRMMIMSETTFMTAMTIYSGPRIVQESVLWLASGALIRGWVGTYLRHRA